MRHSTCWLPIPFANPQRNWTGSKHWPIEPMCCMCLWGILIYMSIVIFLSGQVVRRMRDQHFPRYHLDNQKECEEFVGALKSLLEHVPLSVDVPALLSRWRWFGEWSVGCVGVLGDWIVDTVDALWRKG